MYRKEVGTDSRAELYNKSMAQTNGGPNSKDEKIGKRDINARLSQATMEAEGGPGRYIVIVEREMDGRGGFAGAAIAGKMDRIAPVAVRRRASTRK